MLILTRKAGTSLRIGRDVVIQVIQTGRSTVKLGISAPDSVRILRGELDEHCFDLALDDTHDEALMLQH